MPLTNTNILAPLIVGFTLEQIAIDSLVSRFQPIVTNFQKKGMSEADITAGLLTLLRSKKVEITTLKSTEVYTEPPEAAEILSTWLGAKNTLSGRDKLLKVCEFIFMLVILLLMDAFRLKPRSEFLRNSFHLLIN